MTRLARQQQAARVRRRKRLYYQEGRRWKNEALCWQNMAESAFGCEPTRTWIWPTRNDHIRFSFQEPRKKPAPTGDPIADLTKALEAGWNCVSTAPGTPLKVESLEATMKLIKFRAYTEVEQSKKRIIEMRALYVLAQFITGSWS